MLGKRGADFCQQQTGRSRISNDSSLSHISVFLFKLPQCCFSFNPLLNESFATAIKVPVL